MPLLLVDSPQTEPMAASEIRSRLGIGTELSDAVLNSLIKAARQKLEKQYGLALITQTWNLTLDRFPGIGIYPYPVETGFYPPDRFDSRWRPDYGNRLQSFEIPINLTPLQDDAIQSITYLDSSGVLQTLDVSNYSLLQGDLKSSIVLTNQSAWPSTAFVAGAITIEIEAGFGGPSDVPETIKTAISLHVAHLRSLTANNLFLSLDSVPGVGEKRYIVGTGSTDVIDAAVSSLMQDYVRPSL